MATYRDGQTVIIRAFFVSIVLCKYYTLLFTLKWLSIGSQSVRNGGQRICTRGKNKENNEMTETTVPPYK